MRVMSACSLLEHNNAIFSPEAQDIQQYVQAELSISIRNKSDVSKYLNVPIRFKNKKQLIVGLKTGL